MPTNLLLAYPDLPSEQKQEVEKQIHRAPYALNVEEMRHLRDVGFAFGRFEAYWIDQYLDLAQLVAEHGHAPAPLPTRRLTLWSKSQRQNHRDGQLDPGREQALNRLGFKWEVQEERWLKVFARYCRCQRTRGKLTSQLTQWATRMRQGWDDLPAYQQQLLATAGLVGYSKLEQEQNWESQMCALEEFARIHGSLRGIKDPLRSFFVQVRKAKKAGRLRPEQAARLKRVSLGWKFDRKSFEPGYSSLGEMRYAQVKAYVEKCGAEMPAMRRWEDQTLAHWVRGLLNRWERLSEPERQRLTALNLGPESFRLLDWKKKYDRAEKLYKKIGPSTLHRYRQADNTAGAWLIYQLKRWDRLTQEQQKHLSAMGLDPQDLVPLSTRDRHRKWHKKFAEIQEFYQRLGPPGKALFQQANPSFAGWLRAQVRKWFELSPEQQHCLTELHGGQPEAQPGIWQKHYRQAQAIHAQHHPRTIVEYAIYDRATESWLSKQRERWDGLSPSQQDQLIALEISIDRPIARRPKKNELS